MQRFNPEVLLLQTDWTFTSERPDVVRGTLFAGV